MKPLLAFAGFVVLAAAQSSPRVQVGPLPDGSVLLPTGWKLKPAGEQVPLDTLPMSLAASPDGKYLVVLNGGYKPPTLTVLDAATNKPVDNVPVADAWLGLTILKDGRIYVGGGSRATVFEFTIGAGGKLTRGREFALAAEAQRTPADFVGDVTVSPDGRLIYAAELFHDRIAVINPQSGRVIERYKTGRRPYRILFHPDGRTYFVSSWTDGAIYHHDAINGSEIARLRLGPHTTDMVWSSRKPDTDEQDEKPAYQARLFITASNTNNVYAVGISEAKDMKLAETINVAMAPRQPLGMTPTALGLSPDQKRLFVTCSDANAVAVADISGVRTHIEGFIPSGWYPTAGRMAADSRLLILNGRGLQQNGSMSVIAPFTDEQLDNWTREAAANSPYRDQVLDGKPSALDPIEHIIYIVRNGAADGPNVRKFAAEFVRFDNFYLNGAGHSWTTAAIGTDFTEKLEPGIAAGRHSEYEGREPADTPPAGYIWTNALSAGLPVRNYGFFVINRKAATAEGDQIESFRDPALAPVTNRKYRGTDAQYSDVERARVFLDDWRQFSSAGKMPRLMIVRLDDDAALGQLVEAVSKSPFWPKTAVFIAPAVAGKVDEYRAPAFVLSPYTRRGGTVDSSMYNQTSMLRTIELILGLRPMTIFDAASRPMTTVFTSKPDPTPYTAAR